MISELARLVQEGRYDAACAGEVAATRDGLEPLASDIHDADNAETRFVLVGRSALGQTERVGIYTTLLGDGSLFYYLTVVPQDDQQIYAATFDRVGNSIRLNDR